MVERLRMTNEEYARLDLGVHRAKDALGGDRVAGERATAAVGHERLSRVVMSLSESWGIRRTRLISDLDELQSRIAHIAETFEATDVQIADRCGGDGTRPQSTPPQRDSAGSGEPPSGRSGVPGPGVPDHPEPGGSGGGEAEQVSPGSPPPMPGSADGPRETPPAPTTPSELVPGPGPADPGPGTVDPVPLHVGTGPGGADVPPGYPPDTWIPNPEAGLDDPAMPEVVRHLLVRILRLAADPAARELIGGLVLGSFGTGVLVAAGLATGGRAPQPGASGRTPLEGSHREPTLAQPPGVGGLPAADDGRLDAVRGTGPLPRPAVTPASSTADAPGTVGGPPGPVADRDGAAPAATVRFPAPATPGERFAPPAGGEEPAAAATGARPVPADTGEGRAPAAAVHGSAAGAPSGAPGPVGVSAHHGGSGGGDGRTPPGLPDAAVPSAQPHRTGEEDRAPEGATAGFGMGMASMLAGTAGRGRGQADGDADRLERARRELRRLGREEER